MRASNEVPRHRKRKVRRGGRVGEGSEAFPDSNFLLTANWVINLSLWHLICTYILKSPGQHNVLRCMSQQWQKINCFLFSKEQNLLCYECSFSYSTSLVGLIFQSNQNCNYTQRMYIAQKSWKEPLAWLSLQSEEIIGHNA